jgi:hypothetical protein
MLPGRPVPGPHIRRHLDEDLDDCRRPRRRLDGRARARRQPRPQPGGHLRQLPRHQRLVADYKSGAQPATIMHQIAKGYTDEQIKLVAGYFAAQQPKK